MGRLTLVNALRRLVLELALVLEWLSWTLVPLVFALGAALA